MKILVINGPNMNMLGIREPEVYGRKTYEDLVEFIKEGAAIMSSRSEVLGKVEALDKDEASGELGGGKAGEIYVEFFQSNHEGAIIDMIQSAFGTFDGIVINPAAYTHTSIAIADAIKAVGIPTVEVHLTDTDEREEYRRVSFVKEACIETIKGRGFQGYLDAIQFLMNA